MNENAEKELEKYKLRLEELIVECTYDLGEVNKFLEEKIEQQKQVDYTDNKKPNKIMVGENILFKLRNSTILITVERIKYIAANNQYTTVVLDDNRHVLFRRSLVKWESLLPENIFLRIHRSTIINIGFIDKIENNSNRHYVILKNTTERFEISRRFYKKLDNL